MATVDVLVDMGFPKERAERAIELTNGSGVEAAMEWLIAHEGEELPPLKEETSANNTNEAPTESANEQTESTDIAQMNSYKCNDCDKLFRDMDALMFHATKSGHENFSESSEEIKPLTAEEKMQKEAELRDKIKAARAKKEEAEKQENIEKERRRREEGKKMLENREKQKEMEFRAIADERRRQKQEDQDAKKRILEQIRLDKEARKARETGMPIAEPSAPLHVAAPVPKVDYDKATIQIRLIDGKTVKQQFSANETLGAVRAWLLVNHTGGQPFELLQPYPRRQFTSDDYDAPLKALGLVPTASIVMTR